MMCDSLTNGISLSGRTKSAKLVIKRGSYKKTLVCAVVSDKVCADKWALA